MPLLFLLSVYAGALAPLSSTEANLSRTGDDAGGGSEQVELASTPVGEGGRPTVHLVVDPGLSEWLVVRLVEDGYPLTGIPGAAQVQLSVVSNAEGGWSVTASGASSVTFEVEAATDPAVIRLELLHRSLDALEDVEPQPEPQETPATVGLGVAAASPPSLAPQVAAGVLAAGATLVPDAATPQFRVCAEQSPGDASPRIAVIEGAAACDAALGSMASPRDTPPALTSALVTAALGTEEDTGADSIVDAAPEDVVPRPVEPAPTDPERPPGLAPRPDASRRTRMADAPLILRGGLSAGATWRLSEADAVFSGWATVGWEPGVAAWLELQARPVAVVGQLRIFEVYPAMGFKVRPLSVRRFSLMIGALIGPEIHTYRSRVEQASARGTHVAASVDSMLGVAIRVWKTHEFHTGLRLGGSAGRIHRIQGLDVWERRPLRVGVTAGFSFGRELGT